MICKTTKELQNKILSHMIFTPFIMDNYTIYKNKEKPELGYFIMYNREDYYDLKIGDYTIAEDFSISFDYTDELMRFGTIYTGESPSSFFISRRGAKGSKTWIKGQRFRGVEITIYKKYFDEIIEPNFSSTIDFDNFINNYTYKYLPLEIASIIQNLKSLAETNSLTPIYLESKILESIAILHNEISSSPENVFTRQLSYGEFTIGKSRRIILTESDANAIQKAHDILTKEACNPPTIKSLSKMVFLNEQKLKGGFFSKYHMTISQYTNSIRMTLAENLLSTTDLSIDEISKMVGYNHTSNFIKMFKKVHGKTPLAFRKI